MGIPIVDTDVLVIGAGLAGLAAARRLHRLTNPLRDPTGAPSAALAGIGRLSDRLRFAALATRLATIDPDRLLAAPEVSTQTALRRAGLSHRIIEELLRPFLSGVFADRELTTSSHVFAMVVRSFARGRIGVPARGMAALPRALAAPLPADRIRLDTPVERVAPGAVHTAAARIGCRAVLIATDPTTAARLLPDLPAPRMRALTTYYHAAPEAPLREPVLLLDGDRRELVANTVVVSNAAPTYAPPGRHLIATSVAGPAVPEPVVRAELARLYGRPTADWTHLTTVELPQALPAADPPQGHLRKPVALGDRRYVAGDHRDSPSIQGALASGWRAAGAVLRDLRAHHADGE